ncbi:ABC transporter permease [Lactovum odontotermitis]
MINAIRADIYRLFHSKGFWITQAVMLIVVISIVAQKVGSVGVSMTSSSDAPAKTAAAQAPLWTPPYALLNFQTMSPLLIYFLLSLFVIIIGYDLKMKTLKNLFSSGMSRPHFFFSKFLIFNVIILIQFIFYFGLTFITAAILHGIGHYPSDFFSIFFGAWLLQLLFVQAIFAIGILVLYLTFSTVWAVLAIIFFPIAISLASVITKLNWLNYFDFQSAMGAANNLPHGQIYKLILSALAAIIVLVGASYFYFQKKDL